MPKTIADFVKDLRDAVTKKDMYKLLATIDELELHEQAMPKVRVVKEKVFVDRVVHRTRTIPNGNGNYQFTLMKEHLQKPCSYCGVGEGVPCKTKTGALATWPHRSRRLARARESRS